MASESSAHPITSSEQLRSPADSPENVQIATFTHEIKQGSIWTRADTISIAEFDDIRPYSAIAICDGTPGCKNPPKYNNSRFGFDLCEECKKSRAVITSQLFVIKEMNDAMCDVDAKCMFCSTVFAHTTRMFSYSRGEYADKRPRVCERCHDMDIMANVIWTNLRPMHDQMYVVERILSGALIDLSRPISRTVHPEIALSEQNVSYWLIAIDKIAQIPEDFGPAFGWAFLTEPYDILVENSTSSVLVEDSTSSVLGNYESTALLVDCNTATSGRVASILFDNHGRAGVNIIFNTYEEYKDAEAKWRIGFDAGTLPENAKFIKEHGKENDPRNWTEFSAYIRAELSLPYYYG